MSVTGALHLDADWIPVMVSPTVDALMRADRRVRDRQQNARESVSRLIQTPNDFPADSIRSPQELLHERMA